MQAPISDGSGREAFDVGLATDGDADRLGIMDENGGFVTQLQVFALLAYYFLVIRGERGPIVRSITTSRMVDRLGDNAGKSHDSRAVRKSPKCFRENR